MFHGAHEPHEPHELHEFHETARVGHSFMRLQTFGQIAGATAVAPQTSDSASSPLSFTVPVPLVGSLCQTLCGSSRPTPVLSSASSQNTVRSVLISAEVVSLAERWLMLHMGSQDTRFPDVRSVCWKCM